MSDNYGQQLAAGAVPPVPVGAPPEAPDMRQHDYGQRSRIRCSGLGLAIATTIDAYARQHPELTNAEVRVVLSEELYRLMDHAWGRERRMRTGKEVKRKAIQAAQNAPGTQEGQL